MSEPKRVIDRLVDWARGEIAARLDKTEAHMEMRMKEWVQAQENFINRHIEEIQADMVSSFDKAETQVEMMGYAIERRIKEWGRYHPEGWTMQMSDHGRSLRNADIEDRLRVIENIANKMRDANPFTDDEVSDLKAKYDCVTIELHDFKEGLLVGDGQLSVPSASSPPGLAPPEAKVRRLAPTRLLEERTTARIGNLGWDCPGDVLIARAKHTLQEAEVDESSWHNMSVVRDLSSVVQLAFRTGHELERAQLQVNIGHNGRRPHQSSLARSRKVKRTNAPSSSRAQVP